MRDYKIDNIKGILIFLVVFGHLLELSLGYGIHKSLYVMIYSFHMPLFVFTTGYFAKYNPKKILWSLVLPYLVFQTLYLLFDRQVLGHEAGIQFGTPYWILWYLMAVMIWTFLKPLAAKVQHRLLLLSAACVISLLAGYVDGIGRGLSLSRIIVFFPFFLFGWFSREWKLAERLQNKKYIGIPVLVVTGISVMLSIWNAEMIKTAWLYEATSYAKGGYGILFRGMHLLTAFSFTVAALLWIPNRNIHFLSQVGQKTLPIFLLHGFVIKMIGKYDIFQNMRYQTAAMLLFTVAIIFVLQSRLVTGLFSSFSAFSSKQGKERQRDIPH